MIKLSLMLVIGYTLIDSTLSELSPSLAHLPRSPSPSTHLLIVRPGSCQRLLP